jgi:hypothetical protein
MPVHVGPHRAIAHWTCVVAIALFATACPPRSPSPDAARAASDGYPTVVLHPPAGPEIRVRVELARSDEERRRGLMYRRNLDAGTGMLFIFDRPEPQKFWMKNTFIPLDMIFIDEQRRVIFVEENAEPLTLDPRGPDMPALYVLEVPGGWSRTAKIAPGTKVELLNVRPD